MIALIDKLPAEVVTKMSERSASIKNNLKVPMVLLCATAGCMNGCTLVFLKVGGEVLNSPEWKSNIMFSGLMMLMGFGAAFAQMLALNLSMKYYNNLDVMPIYQALVLIGMITAGLVLLNESELYTLGDLCLLSASALFVVAGIFVLTKK